MRADGVMIAGCIIRSQVERDNLARRFVLLSVHSGPGRQKPHGAACKAQPLDPCWSQSWDGPRVVRRVDGHCAPE